MEVHYQDHSRHKSPGEDQMCHNDMQSLLWRLSSQPAWQNPQAQDENELQLHQKRECQHFLFL